MVRQNGIDLTSLTIKKWILKLQKGKFDEVCRISNQRFFQNGLVYEWWIRQFIANIYIYSNKENVKNMGKHGKTNMTTVWVPNYWTNTF